MKSLHITVANVTPGEGQTLLFADVRLEFAPGIIAVLRDVRLYENRQGGRFVRFPRRFRGECYYDLVGFEGVEAARLTTAIRAALVGQLATAAELAEEAMHDANPF